MKNEKHKQRSPAPPPPFLLLQEPSLCRNRGHHLWLGKGDSALLIGTGVCRSQEWPTLAVKHLISRDSLFFEP